MAVLGKAFDRFDLRPFGFWGQDDAAIHRQAVQQHGASAAVAVVAAFLRTGQVQRISKHFQQALPSLAEEFGRFAVDRRGDVEFFGHGRGSGVSGKWCLGASALGSFQKRPFDEYADEVHAVLGGAPHVGDWRSDLRR